MNALDFARQRTDMLAEGVTKFFEEKLGDTAHATSGGEPANGTSNDG
jgi:hypothetical protein